MKKIWTVSGVAPVILIIGIAAAFIVTIVSVAFVLTQMPDEKKPGTGTKAPAQPSNTAVANLTPEQQIHALIKQLGDADPAVVQAAYDQLLRKGTAVLPQLQAAANDPDPNISGRAKRLISSITRRERIARLLGINPNMLRVGPRQPAFRPDTGPIPVDKLSLDLMESYGIELGEGADGLRVLRVKPGSVTAKLGVVPGDLLISINGRQVVSLDEAKGVFDQIEPDRLSHMDVSRRGEIVTLGAH